MLTVGAFGDLAGVSAKALRAYDERGLFRPAWVDPLTGYRFYSPAQLPEIRRILALRSVGLGLDEIGRLVSGRADLALALARRRLELEAERTEIDRRLAALAIRIETDPDRRPMAIRGTSGRPAVGDRIAGIDVVVRPIAAEPVASLRLDRVPGADPETAFDLLEARIRDLGRRAARPPGAFADRIFVPVSGRIPTDDPIAFEILPALSAAATVLHRGGYGAMAGTRRALDHWIASTGHVRSGPARILYLQFGADAGLRLPRGYVVDDPAAYVTELQVPIEPARRRGRARRTT